MNSALGTADDVLGRCSPKCPRWRRALSSFVATPSTITLDEMLNRCAEISTLPQVALAVIEVASDPDAGAGELKDAVEIDPALSARVLRVVNSAAYGLRTTITNLHQAVSYVGFNQIRNLALTASVSEVFKSGAAIGTYQRAGLWRHLVSVGLCARLLASRLKLPGFEDAYLAGLLHDIGIILIDQHAHEQFRAVIGSLNERTTLINAERSILGFDHCAIGARVAETWRFPELTRAAIRFHHNALSYTGAGAALVACVEIANVVCTMKGISSVGRKIVPANTQVFAAQGLRREDILVLAQDLDTEISNSRSLFDL